jgi:putative flippase GtrA
MGPSPVIGLRPRAPGATAGDGPATQPPSARRARLPVCGDLRPLRSTSMKLSVSALLDHARSPEGRKQLRYAGVSLVFVPVGQVFVQLFGYLLNKRGVANSYTLASLLTAAVLTLPNFFANKIYVWRVTSKDNLRTQVVVFWVAAMLGVSFATALTFLTERLMTDQGPVVKGLAVFVAQLAGFGIVWVGRFLVLDRWLFKVTQGGAEPSQDEVDELHSDLPI